MKRLFSAVKVPFSNALKKVCTSYKQQLSDEDIKWVDASNLHITLKFFGDTPFKDIQPIIEAFKKAACKVPAFSFSLNGTGSFGSSRQPRVIWVGVQKSDALINLYDIINQHLKPLGYQPEKVHYAPHLTIGRIKFIRDVHGLHLLESEFAEEDMGIVKVDSFSLFQSKLTSTGPVYTVVEQFVLQS
jgi:RNA 2',3'-cyclic 3'-phosphodiesterase